MKHEVPGYTSEEKVTGFIEGRSGPSNQHGDTGGASRFFTTIRCAPGCPVEELDKQSGTSKSSGGQIGKITRDTDNAYAGGWDSAVKGDPGFGDVGGASRFFTTFKCVPGCPVDELNNQSGIRTSGTGNFIKASAAGYRPNALGTESRPEGTEMISYGDTGGADRYFTTFKYSSKPSGKEKNEGCKAAGEINTHPTVKSVELMQWLCTLITPEKGIVLDPFCGSGSTGVAAVKLGFSFLGIDLEKQYVKISRLRIGNVNKEKT
jgi:hypothetical protein